MLGSFDSPMRRRTFLVGAATAGGAALGGAELGGDAHAASPDAPPGGGPSLPQDVARHFDTPKKSLDLYLKLNSDLGGAPRYGWYSGHVFGVSQGQLTVPLLGIEGFGQGWIEPGPDGSWRQVWKEVGYYKDLVTHRILDTWRNPINGATCEVMHINNRSVNTTLVPYTTPFRSADLQVEMGAAYVREPDPQHPFVVPWVINGDMVAVTMDARVAGRNPLDPKEWPRESSGEFYSVTEFFTQYGSLRELLDRRRTSASYVGQWTRISPWLPWMLMGRTPGQCVLRCATRKLSRIEDVPTHIRDYTQANFPDFMRLLTREEAQLPPESSWEVFKARRRPTPL